MTTQSLITGRTYGTNYNGRNVIARWYVSAYSVDALLKAQSEVAGEAAKINGSSELELGSNQNGIYLQACLANEYCGCPTIYNGKLALELERMLAKLGFKRSKATF